jgi:hypothetical protein
VQSRLIATRYVTAASLLAGDALLRNPLLGGYGMNMVADGVDLG